MKEVNRIVYDFSRTSSGRAIILRSSKNLFELARNDIGEVLWDTIDYTTTVLDIIEEMRYHEGNT